MFNVEGTHESWENDPNAPHEMILTMATNEDYVDPYHNSANPVPWTCPAQHSPSESYFESLILGINSVKDKIGGWMNNKYRSGKHPDFFKNFFELSTDQGMSSECHSVVTDDGYILNLFRVRDSRTKEGAPVVFLQHGLFASAENWVSN